MHYDKGTKTTYHSCCLSCSKARHVARKLQNLTVLQKIENISFVRIKYLFSPKKFFLIQIFSLYK